MPELKQMLEDMEWKRVSELRVAPQLFTGSLYGGLIIRSGVAPVDDGNFLGAMVSAAQLTSGRVLSSIPVCSVARCDRVP